MKKNAFTLTELLGVITILGLILLIVIPTVDRVLKDGKNELYQSQIQSIETSAQIWGTDHIGELPEKDKFKIITLGRLQQDGAIDKKIENPKTGKPFDESLEIKITNHGTYYSYKVITK